MSERFFLEADFFNTAALLLPDHDHYQSVIFVYLKKGRYGAQNTRRPVFI